MAPPLPPVPPTPPVAAPPTPPVAVPPVAVPPVAVPPSPTPVPPEEQDEKPKDPVPLTSVGECKKRLKELKIPKGNRVFAKTSAVFEDPHRQIPIQTNVFGMELKKDTIIYGYTVHIKADVSPTKEAVFTKKGKEDYIVLDRHSKCCDIFFKAIDLYPDFFKMSDDNKIIYDGQALLYTTIDLFPGIDDRKDKIKMLEVDGAKIDNDDLHGLPCIKVEVFASERQQIVFSRQNLLEKTAEPEMDKNDRSYIQFLELVLNQNCIRDTKNFACFEHGKVYCVNPKNFNYQPMDLKDVGDGKELLCGLKKSVQMIEGPYKRNNNNPSIVVDAMKAAFHKHQSVYEKIHEIIGNRNTKSLGKHELDFVVPVLRGLDCYSDYTGRKRHLRIEGIHHENALKARFELKDGGSVSVYDYFRDKYHLALKHPDMNLLICQDRGNKNFFPMEFMTISPNQRVTIPQQTGRQSQATTKECAVLPFVRQRLIMLGAHSQGLIGTDNQLFLDLGLKMFIEPCALIGHVLPVTKAEYSEREDPVRCEGGKWKPARGHYFKPAIAPACWALYAVGNPGCSFRQDDLQKFAEEFIAMSKDKGARFQPPTDMRLIGADKIEETLKHAANNGCKFSLVITDDRLTQYHGMYKVVERNHNMLVQDLKMKTALAVLNGKRLTLENIFNKTNVKLGGLNYKIIDKMMVEENLIVGIGQSAPPVTTKYMHDSKTILNPSVIGYSSNARDPLGFEGDFILAARAQEAFAAVEKILEKTIKLWLDANPKKTPSKIIVYRVATGENAYSSILEYEIPLARAALKKANVDGKLIYIVVTKDHAVRFFKNQGGSSLSSASSRSTISNAGKPTEQNIPPGVSIHHSVTHPSIKQFYLNSHLTLQGSAKTPLYSVLVDDFNAPSIKLEELTYFLCHQHQIVNMVTSIPTPLYVATEYAKRGRTLWTERTAEEFIRGHDSDHKKLEAFTKELNYSNTEFTTRVNA